MRFFALTSVVTLTLATAFTLPVAPASAERGVAVRAEGYLGYTKIDVETPFGDRDEDALQGGGTGSVSLLLDSLYLQADIFGDVPDYDGLDLSRVGGGGHLGWRDGARGSAGVVGTINHVDTGSRSTDEWRAGIEGQIFLPQLTVGLNAGFFDGNASSNANGNELAYLEGRLSYYPTEQVRLSFRGGALGVGEDDSTALISAGAEFLAHDHFAIFGRWEAAFFEADNFEVDEHSVVGGVRVYWGDATPSLKSYDREWFNESCLGVLNLGRSC